MNDTKRTTTIDVDTKTVDVTRNTKTSKDGKQYQNHWILNYDNVTDEQLLSLATRGIVIDLQRQFRDATPAQRDELVEQDIDVAELMRPRTRVPRDERAEAIKYLASLSDEDRTVAVAEARNN